MSRDNPGLFLFDIDGTLLRGGIEVHRDAFAHAFREVYEMPLDLDGISAGGRTDTWLLAEPLRRRGVLDEAIWAKMREAFRLMEAYVDEHLGDLRDRVLPGVGEVLGRLRREGQVLGILTGNLSRIAASKLDKADLSQHFDAGGFGEESELRAHLVPVAVAKAGKISGHKFRYDQVVVIGDTPLDVEAGRAHHARTVAVATGPYDLAALEECGADLVLPSLADARASVAALMFLVHESS
jgi:phosphoglycolate phosphatase